MRAVILRHDRLEVPNDSIAVMRHEHGLHGASICLIIILIEVRGAELSCVNGRRTWETGELDQCERGCFSV